MGMCCICSDLFNLSCLIDTNINSVLQLQKESVYILLYYVYILLFELNSLVAVISLILRYIMYNICIRYVYSVGELYAGTYEYVVTVLLFSYS